MSFLQRFQTSLESLYILPKKAHYVIAYSGGVDSHVLLHCCAMLKLPVRAVHVHHGLQLVADDWVEHCETVCKQLNIVLDVVYVDANKKQRESPEESARKARYHALQKCLTEDDCLLTAQHLNDQAETFLLQLFRASGAAGLSAMPALRNIGNNIQLRPLLSFTRNDIVDYAKENNLNWVEDPSNDDITLDRNFIRAELLPLLENRWPEIAAKLSSAAQLQANNLLVMEDMAAIDIANVVKQERCSSVFRFYSVLSVLSISKLKKLSSARLLNALRFWMLESFAKELFDAGSSEAQAIQLDNPDVQTSKILPTRNLLEELEQSLVRSQQDSKAVISFSGYEFRKYQDSLYLLKPMLRKENIAEIRDAQLPWNPSQVLQIKQLCIQLKCLKQTNTNVNALKISLLDELTNNKLNRQLNVRFRQGGEMFHPAKREHSQRLKKLLQEANIPPWERDLIPLIYLDEELIAITGLWVSKKYAVSGNELGWVAEASLIKPE